ncbi:ABC transporter ATP-binding protein [Alkaliphilus crotonatoxidans]
MSNQNKQPMSRPGSPYAGRFAKNKVKLKNPKGTAMRLLGYLGNKKKAMLLAFLLAFISTIVNIVGTRFNGYTIDHFIALGNLSGLARICVTLAVIYLISAISIFFQNRLMVGFANQTAAEIRRDLYQNMQQLPLSYFDTHSSGDLMSRLTNDVDNINMTLSQSIPQLFSGVIMITGMLVAMLLLSPLLTLIGLAATPLMFLLTRLIVKAAQPYFVRQQEELGKLNGYIEEMVSGQKAVLLFSQEEKVKRQFASINRSLTKTAVLAQGLSGFMGPVNNFINNLTYVAIAVGGGFMVLKGTGITVGIVFTFILYMRNFTRPINEILNTFNTIQSALAGAERVFEVIDEPKEKDEPKALSPDHFDGQVIFENVCFSYTNDKPILKNINLLADKGQTIAIVGPTGSGKTTIINLLTKFYDIDSGKILIDGININQIKRESLRKTISVVLQDTFLFSESVMENIRYGRLTATDEEVIEAARMANAHSFIKQLPQGYNTVLSDNGSNLSHGQRQLLAIARAILSRSSILILDEATSSIDTRTEIAIQKAMLTLMEGKTTFVIAHRLSTIRNADLILAIKDGRIIEQGTHDALLTKEGFYAQLYYSQFRSGIAL